jgi:hypothetical protein
MSESPSGIETFASVNCRAVENFDLSLLDDVEDALLSPIDTLGKVGSGAVNAVVHPINTLQNVGSAVGTVGGFGLDVASKVGSAAFGSAKKSVSFVGETAETVFDRALDQQQGSGSNLDRVSGSGIPSHHSDSVQASAEPAAPKKRGYLRTVVNWAIVLLIIVLVGVLLYLTFNRWVLAGNALMSGDRLMAATLLSPELSSSISTLAATF